MIIVMQHGATTEQVGGAALDFACARSTECELETSVLEEPMSFIEQCGNFLDFVDDDLAITIFLSELLAN